MRKDLIEYKNQIGDLRTNMDLEVYKGQLDIAKCNKSYFRCMIKSAWPIKLVFGLVMAGLTAGVASEYTDKMLIQASAGIVLSALFVFVIGAGINSEEYKVLRHVKRRENFLSKAIREYESSKAQQTNAINNAAINTK